MFQRLFILPLILFCTCFASAQQGPWQNALIMVRSNDGVNFNSPSVFQDSSGVPCVIRWKNDTLVCVFQWFRQPMGSATWDRVAVKFSYNNGNSWTDPVPIVVNNMPVNYQRPFDPTIVATSDQRLRIYFSSSDGIPTGLDASVNTYSAIGDDGINFNFEPGARFDHPTTRVIDPAVTFFNSSWQYTCPIGAPQDGAYHCTSPDGLTFTQLGNISSDNTHNWTGNLLADGSLLKFYGSGPLIWYNSSSDGINWNGFVSTNTGGGDPGIVKLSNGSYIMIFVGPNPVTSTFDPNGSIPVRIYPNPFLTEIKMDGKQGHTYSFSLFTSGGALLQQGSFNAQKTLNLEKLSPGVYLLVTEENKKTWCTRIVKK